MTGNTTAMVRQRRQRAARHLHALGPRPVLEALIQASESGNLDGTLEAFTRLDADIVRQVGGDQFPPTPLHVIGGIGR